jgi:hypothetical protein
MGIGTARFWTTFFDDVLAQSLQGEDTTLDNLRDLIRGTIAPTKEAQPLIKLARFGRQRSPAGALRWDANVLACSGCELDYDRGEMPLSEAVARLDAAGIPYLAYTTASHTPSRPRWRILLPFGAELPPADRGRMVDRANGILGGALAHESWAISTAFYFGNIAGRPDAEIVVGDGEEYVDEAEELDQTALPFRAAAGRGGKPDLDQLDEVELLELIQTGQVYYGPPSVSSNFGQARRSRRRTPSRTSRLPLTRCRQAPVTRNGASVAATSPGG